MALRDLGNWFYKKLDSGNKYAADMAERQYQQVVDQRVRDLQAQSRANPAMRQANSARIAAIGANAQVKPNQTMAQMQDIYGGSAEQDFYQNFGAGVMKYWSPQSIAGSALEQTGRLLNNRTIKNAGTRLAQPVRDYSQTMAGVAQDSALSELAGNLGQVSGAMLPAMLTPTTVVQGTGRLAPAALALSPQAATAARVASLINRGGVVARTGVIGGADVSQAIEQSGGSRAKQLIGGGIVGAVTGGLNAAATDALTGKVVGRLGQNAGTRMFNSGVANAAENVGDQLVQNYVAQKTYDPNRQLTDQMGQNIGTGFIFGAGMRGVGEYANARVPGNQGGFIAGPRAAGYDAANKSGKVFTDTPDKMPRFEVDDSGAKIHPERLKPQENLQNLQFQYAVLKNAQATGKLPPYGAQRLASLPNEIRAAQSAAKKGNSFKLSDFLQHDKLYEQYPDLANATVKLYDGKNIQEFGQYDPTTDTVQLNKNALDSNPEIVKGALLHEIQHAIQQREGFASGGGITQDTGILAGRANKQRVADGKAPLTTYDAYQRLAGEAEARAVAARADMPEGERYKQGTQYYHGTTKGDEIRQSGFKVGKPTHGQFFGKGTYITDSPKKAKGYAFPYTKGENGEVLEVNIPDNLKIYQVKKDEILNFNATKIKKQGYDGLSIPQLDGSREVTVFDPKNVQLGKAKPRSTFYDSLDVPKNELILRGQDGKTMSAEQSIAKQKAIREGNPVGFDYDTDKVARERFDIPSLKKISSGGSDRDVYDLGDGNVLKVAKTARGLAQNQAENDYYAADAGLIPKVQETGLNYVVSQKVNPPDANVKAMLKAYKQQTNGMVDPYLKQRKFEEVSSQFGYSGGDLANYDYMLGDFAAIRNWGTTADGKPVHIDGGSLNKGILNDPRYSAQNNWFSSDMQSRKPKNLDDADFREVYYRSKAAKKQYGDTDKATMYSIDQPRNLTTGLEALQYPTFEGFYNDYKSFFDDMGFNADQAREVYIAGQGAKVIPSGQTGTRASASAQSDFELAYNSGNKAKALEAAQQIADPTAKRAALQALGQDVSTLPVAEGVTNPAVKAMMEAAAKRKAEAANQQPAPKTSLFGDERGSIAVVDEPKPKTQQPITVSSKKTEVKLNANRLDLPKSVKAKITKETTQLIDTMSNKEVMDLAKRSGMDTKTYSDAQVRQQIAEQLNVRRGAVELERQAMAMRKEGANPDEIAKIILQARELENTSREQGTGIARQLQARRIIADEMKTPMQRVMMLLDKAGVNPEVAAKRLATVDFDDANQVVAAYRELVPAKPGEWLDTLRYNSMLSSPLTHIINISSNLTNAAVVAPIEKTIAGALDAVFHPGKRTKFAGEGAAYLKGAASAIPQAGQKFIDVMRGKQSATNLDLRDNVPLATTGPAAKIGTALNYPMRLLEASDQFFTTLVRAGEMSDIDMKQKRGVTIKNADNVADANAAYRLFRQRPGDASQGTVLQTIDGFTNMLLQARSGRFGKGVATISRWTLPFVQTPMNIFKQGVEYSPAGFTTMIGAADPTTQAAKAIMGSTVFMGVSTLLGAGRLTWAEPTNPDEKDRFRAEGKQPYAVKIGDTWINFSKLAPTVAFPFAAVASINDSFEKGKMDESTFDKVVGGIAKYGNFMADQSYVKTVGDLLASVKGDAEDFARAAANYPQQVIPMRAFTGWLARMTDDTERKLDGGFINKQVQSFMQQYPGLRQGTPERTANGQPIPANNPVINAFSPARVTTAREGVVVGSSGSTGVTITGDKKTANVEIKALRDRAMPGDYGLTQVSDGRYAATINGEVKAYDSLDKARLDMAKSRFADTGQETQEWRDKLFIRNEDGSVKVDDKIVYDYRQIDSQLSLAKSYGDINTWNQLAQAKLQNLMEQRGRLNPRTQGDKIAKIDRDIYELKKTSIKYAQQGGFSGRGRSGKRILPNVDTSVSFGGPVVARSSYRAPGVKLSKRGGLPIGPSRRVQITAPKKLA